MQEFPASYVPVDLAAELGAGSCVKAFPRLRRQHGYMIDHVRPCHPPGDLWIHEDAKAVSECPHFSLFHSLVPFPKIGSGGSS